MTVEQLTKTEPVELASPLKSHIAASAAAVATAKLLGLSEWVRGLPIENDRNLKRVLAWKLNQIAQGN